MGSKKQRDALTENIIKQSTKTFGSRMSFQKDSLPGTESVLREKEGKLHYFQQHKLMIHLLGLEVSVSLFLVLLTLLSNKVKGKLLCTILFLNLENPNLIGK